MSDQLREWRQLVTISVAKVHNQLNMQLRRLLGNRDAVEVIMQFFRLPMLIRDRWMQWEPLAEIQLAWPEDPRVANWTREGFQPWLRLPRYGPGF